MVGNDNNSDDSSNNGAKGGRKKRNNPWGENGSSNNGGDKKGDHGQGRDYGSDVPDMDEMLRRAQANFKDVMPGGGGSGKFVVLGAIVALVLWLSSGFYIVNPGEHAVVQRFGAWDRTQTVEGLGYHFPAPFEKRQIVNVNTQRSMTIGFAELRNGQKRNIPQESLMLTSDRNIIDLDLVILWTIKSSEDFLFEVQGQENTIKKVAESAIREVVGQTDMFPIITSKRAAVADAAIAIIQENLDEYNSGVSVNQVLIQQAEVHPDVQAAFQDVQSAKQDADNTKNKAQAYREDIIPKARGRGEQLFQQAAAYKESTVAKATGDADRFESVYKAYLTGKDVTKTRLYLETMENVLGNAQKIIMDTNGGSGVVPYLPLDAMTTQKPAASQQRSR
jgi:membrane protease subunit HflK